MKRSFLVNISIENKPAARDPEGETIYNDLIVKKGFNSIRSVRTAKLLRVTVEAEDADQAKQIVEDMCNKLRIYNPASHSCTLQVGSSDK